MTKSNVFRLSYSWSDCDARGAVRVVSHCRQRHDKGKSEREVDVVMFWEFGIFVKKSMSPIEGQTGETVSLFVCLFGIFHFWFPSNFAETYFVCFCCLAIQNEEGEVSSGQFDFRLLCKSIILGVVEAEQASRVPFLSIASS